MRDMYSHSIAYKSLLPYFEVKVSQLDFTGITENARSEIRFLLIRAIESHCVSNRQLLEILDWLGMKSDLTIHEAALKEYFLDA